MGEVTLTRQQVLVMWYEAYLMGDRKYFNDAENILTKMDRGDYGAEN